MRQTLQQNAKFKFTQIETINKNHEKHIFLFTSLDCIHIMEIHRPVTF
jgi:hypothetical protein